MKKVVKVYFILYILIIIAGGNSYGQTVNIESKRMQSDSIRFVFRGDFGAKYNDNDGKYIFQIKNNISTHLKSKDLNTIYFLVANQDLIRSVTGDFNNSWFLHFRVNHEITNIFRLETFVQNQNNKLLDVSNRFLLGGGIRLKLVSKEFLRLYFGNSYMFEIEQSNVVNNTYFNHRNSSYLSFSLFLVKNTLEAISTIYFQPLYSDFSNFNLLEQLKLDFSISKKISLFTLFDYTYNSYTPAKREQYYSQVSFGIGLKL